MWIFDVYSRYFIRSGFVFSDLKGDRPFRPALLSLYRGCYWKEFNLWSQVLLSLVISSTCSTVQALAGTADDAGFNNQVNLRPRHPSRHLGAPPPALTSQLISLFSSVSRQPPTCGATSSTVSKLMREQWPYLYAKQSRDNISIMVYGSIQRPTYHHY